MVVIEIDLDECKGIFDWEKNAEPPQRRDKIQGLAVERAPKKAHIKQTAEKGTGEDVSQSESDDGKESIKRPKTRGIYDDIIAKWSCADIHANEDDDNAESAGSDSDYYDVGETDLIDDSELQKRFVKRVKANHSNTEIEYCIMDPENNLDHEIDDEGDEVFVASGDEDLPEAPDDDPAAGSPDGLAAASSAGAAAGNKAAGRAGTVGQPGRKRARQQAYEKEGFGLRQYLECSEVAAAVANWW